TLPSPALGAGEVPTASASPAPLAPPPTTGSPSTLPELPHLAPITLAEPDPAALQELDRLLSRLTAEDDRTRENARTAVGEVGPTLVPAIRHRVQDIRGTLDRDAAPRVIEAARKA